ncbi:MAG TPA: FAD-dependent oxidoreductase [Methanoculleus sp.]|nr:FAD-dependent oxidoreductase [Methanoculleus sp.]
MRWAILGGGLTGVTLARLLAKKGEDVVVLEREATIGGLCRSRTTEGFTFDTGGSHIIFSRDTEILSFMRDVLGDNRDERRRNTKIFYKGNFVKYPFENGLSDLPKEDCFFCLNEYIRTLIAVEKGETPPPRNFREWIYATFGRGIADLYMVPYNEKIWNYPAEKMSLHWVDGRIPRPPVEDIVKSAIGIETEGYTHQAVFSYPVRGGIEALVRAMAAPVQDRIVTDFEVASVRKEGGGVIVSDGTESIEADRCISTIPVQHLLACMDGVPDACRKACERLRYNSLISVCLGITGEVAEYSWLYVPQHDLGSFNRVSFPSNYSTDVAPEGCSSILAEITCNEGDAVSALSDDEVVDHVVEGLVRMGLIESAESVVYRAVEREDFAYVVYDLEYQDNIETVRTYIRDQGIDLVGRFAEFEYLNMDACIRNALEFVKAVP